MQEIDQKRVLIIPDLYEGGGSGAVVTQVIVGFFKENNYKIAIMSSEFSKRKTEDNVECFPCRSFCGTANLRKGSYLSNFRTVLEDFRPSHLFFDGSITNKPLCYLEEGIKRNLNITVFIFMQDFFCSKYYANDNLAPCTKCLDKGLISAFCSDCGVANIGILKLAERIRTRNHLRMLLPKVQHVGTSTEEQLGFYTRFGIPRERSFKLPLPFDDSKLKDVNVNRGDYIVGIAQNRTEKGFQFIPQILKYTKSKVVLAYYDDETVKIHSEDTKLKPFIECGQLKLVASSWNTGLGELIANSQGVIIPSIWPTTTEFGWLEALALGKPTITFDISAHKEFMENRFNGLTSPIGDFKAMAANMDYLCSLDNIEYEKLTIKVKALYATLTDWSGWKEFIKTL